MGYRSSLKVYVFQLHKSGSQTNLAVIYPMCYHLVVLFVGSFVPLCITHFRYSGSVNVRLGECVRLATRPNQRRSKCWAILSIRTINPDGWNGVYSFMVVYLMIIPYKRRQALPLDGKPLEGDDKYLVSLFIANGQGIEKIRNFITS